MWAVLGSPSRWTCRYELLSPSNERGRTRQSDLLSCSAHESHTTLVHVYAVRMGSLHFVFKVAADVPSRPSLHEFKLYIVIRITIHARTVSAKCIVPTRLRRRGGPSRGTAAAHDPTLSPSALFEGPAARTWAGKFVHFEQFFRRACIYVRAEHGTHMLAGRLVAFWTKKRMIDPPYNAHCEPHS